MDALDKQLAEVSSQRGEEWHNHRNGKFTASEIHRLMTAPKDKTESLSEGAKTYALEKVTERITGLPCSTVDTWAMQWGVDHEDEARQSFVLKTGLIVEQSGFVTFGDDAGGSPDGVIPIVNSGIEIKCPANSKNHVEHLLITSQEYFKKYFKEYYWQCQMNMMCCKADNWWFCSFDPRFPEDKKLLVFKVEKNELDHADLVVKIKAAIEYATDLIYKLK